MLHLVFMLAHDHNCTEDDDVDEITNIFDACAAGLRFTVGGLRFTDYDLGF